MRRSIRELISLTALWHIYYVSVAVLRMKNYGSFLLNYIGFRDGPGLCRFRNGVQIRTGEGVDTAAIAVVFLKKDYGEIEDNSTVVDIGANIGAFSVFAASSSRGTKVYSYEPVPESFRLLLENVRMNGLESTIMPSRVGVAGKNGKRKLFLANGSQFHTMYPAKKGRYISIECVTLRDVFETNGIRRCDILKMDCEGAEFEILYNAPEDCLSSIKEIRMEYHNQGKECYDIESLTRFLQDRGLKLVRFRKSSCCSGNAWFRR